MNVTIGCLGRFHAFDLARELDALGELERIYTSYPRTQAPRFGLDPARVTGWPWHELFNRGLQRLASLVPGLDHRAAACEAFDRAVCAALRPGSDVFLGWSGSSLRSLARARELGMLAVVERGSTHILHQHELMTAEYERRGVRGRLAHPATVERELAEYELADRIAVPTRHVARTFLERGVDPHKLIQVPYGVDLTRFQSEDGERGDGFEVVFCGNLSMRKGVPLLLEAFQRLKRPDARLTLVGPPSPETKELLASWPDARVRAVGRVPQEELVRYYQRAHVFCLPSLEEGLAMVLAQAMAMGLPVVATSESGAEELVERGRQGLLVPARDVGALAEALQHLSDDPELRRAQGEAARQRVQSGHSWSDYGRRVSAAYHDALAERAEPCVPATYRRSA